MLRIVALGLCLAGLSGPALAETCLGQPMAPVSARQIPTVYYDQYVVTASRMGTLCPGMTDAIACTYASPTPAHPDRWQIIIIDTLSLEDFACVVAYELSHLPPNYWGDPKMETAATMKYLDAHRAR